MESEVGPWARDKLVRLGKYLGAYATIMQKQSWCQGYVYVDAFAGPGRHKVRQRRSSTAENRQVPLFDFASEDQEDSDQQEYIAGSPRVALEIEPPFTWYVFIEKEPDRITLLNQLRDEFKEKRRVVVCENDCNQYLLDKIVNNPKIDWRKWRGVVFLDPFGMQVPWSTIEALGKTRAIEIFLNLPVGMAIQRLLPRSGKFKEERRKRLDEYFGSPEWYDLLYRTEEDLFGEKKIFKARESGMEIVDWYRRRLITCFGHVSQAALIRNTKGGHLYYLMLATPNKTASKIVDHILSAGETV